MDNTYKQSKKGTVVVWVLVVILLVIAGGAVFVVFNKKDSEPKQENAGSYYQEGMVMSGAPTMRLGEPTGIRYTAIISPETYQTVTEDKNKCFGMVLAPISYFTKADSEEASGNVDWLTEFAKDELVVLTLEDIKPYAITEVDGTLIEYRLNGAISNIKYANTNLQFLGVAYIKTTDGESVSYKYASFPEGLNYKQCSSSYAYLAAEKLNALVVRSEYVSQVDLDLLNYVVDCSVDLANGLSESDLNDSKYTVTLSDTSKALKVNEKFSIKADIAEKVKTPIWWQSSNPTIATVKDGVITALKPGVTTVSAFVAGEEYKCVITVEDVQKNTEAVEE